MMKRICLSFAMAVLSAIAWSASAPPQFPRTLQGNWSTMDGGRQWTYGFYPRVAVWQNAFWEYADITDKGAVTAIRLRERDGDRTATLYARWNPKDSVAMIGLSPKNLTPYSKNPIVNPSYRIPAGEDPDYPGGDSILHDGTAVVRGYLDGYSPESMAGTIKIYSFNTVKNQDLPAVGDIAADGTFEITAELGHPITTQIALTGAFYDNIYLEPGDKLTLYYNLSGQQQARGSLLPLYMGPSGRVNHELNRLRRLYHPFSGPDHQAMMKMTPDSVTRFIEHIMAIESAATEKYIAENGISRKGAFLARWTPGVIGGERLGLYAMYREQKDPVDTAFYGFYRNLPLDDPRTLGINNHRFLINRLEFCPIYWNNGQRVTLRFSDLEQEGFPIEAKDLSLIDSLERNLYAVPGDSAATALAYKRAWDNLYYKYGVFFHIRSAVTEATEIHALGDAYWGRPMSFLNDLIAARSLHSTYNRIGKNIPNCWLAQILAEYNTPYMIATLLEANDALRPVPVAVAAGPYVPSDRGERLLDSLLQQHRGRAVYVDFWSTGCGPCRLGMMESWILKEKLDGKPVDFVYITSTDQSPEQVAADFIEQNKITGRQVCLTPDEWNILAAKYKINGIPHHMIVGPDGRVVNPHYRGYGDDVVRDILKVVGK